MKKLLILVSAISAGFTAAAQVDVVSGSANVAYLSTSGSDAAGDEELAVGTTVDFALSTTTASGLGISGSRLYLLTMTQTTVILLQAEDLLLSLLVELQS